MYCGIVVCLSCVGEVTKIKRSGSTQIKLVSLVYLLVSILFLLKPTTQLYTIGIRVDGSGLVFLHWRSCGVVRANLQSWIVKLLDQGPCLCEKARRSVSCHNEGFGERNQHDQEA